MRGFLGLPDKHSLVLVRGISVFICFMGVKLVLTPNFDLRVMNTQLRVSNSASKLESLAEELEEQAQVIKQKDEAYQHLEQTYRQYLDSEQGKYKLRQSIKAIDDIPEVGNIEAIEAGIEEVEQELVQIEPSN